MKSIITAYKEVRGQAQEAYDSMKANKVVRHDFSITLQELESGNWSVSLVLFVRYSYRNNHTNYATAERSFRIHLSEFASQEIALSSAQVEKLIFESDTNNKIATIRSFELESFLF